MLPFLGFLCPLVYPVEDADDEWNIGNEDGADVAPAVFVANEMRSFTVDAAPRI